MTPKEIEAAKKPIYRKSFSEMTDDENRLYHELAWREYINSCLAYGQLHQAITQDNRIAEMIYRYGTAKTYSIGERISEERAVEIAPSLFACSPKGKKKQQTQRATKTRQEDKQKQRVSIASKHKDTRIISLAKSIKAEQRRRKRWQTRRKSYNRLTTHAHKSHTSRASHQDNTNPHEAIETR